MFSNRAAAVLSLGFLSVSLSIIREHLALLLLGVSLIFYIAVNWIFYSIREKTLHGKDVIIAREIDARTAFINDKIPVTVTVRNNSGRDFDFFKIIDHIPSSFDVLGSSTRIFELKGRSEYKFSYFAVPGRRGVHRFPGFSVYDGDSRELFFNKKFFPVINALTVYPSMGDIDVRGISLPRRSAARVLGIHKSKQRGIGSEFAGIREYVYGDAFKSIAWKAYAKTGRLMTREFESETSVPIIIFLDTSETMDSGRKGYTKLDCAIKAVVAFSKFALDNNDPVGIYTFTDAVQSYIPPKKGKTQLYSIVKSLAMVEAPLVITEGIAVRMLSPEDAKSFKTTVLGIPESSGKFDDVDVDGTIMDNYDVIFEKVQTHITAGRGELALNLLAENFSLEAGERDRLKQDKSLAGKYLALYMIENSLGLSSYRSYKRGGIYKTYMKLVHEHLREIYPNVFAGRADEEESKILEYLETYFKAPLAQMGSKAVFDHLAKYIIENDLKPPLLKVHTGKDLGLYTAIKQAIIRARDSSLFIIISDLEGIEASKKLNEALKLARVYHHNLIILSPFSPWFEKDSIEEKKDIQSASLFSRLGRKLAPAGFFKREDVKIKKITEELLALRFIESRRKFAREMVSIRIPVLSLGPEDLVPMLLSQLIKIKQQKVAVAAR